MAVVSSSTADAQSRSSSKTHTKPKQEASGRNNAAYYPVAMMRYLSETDNYREFLVKEPRMDCGLLSAPDQSTKRGSATYYREEPSKSELEIRASSEPFFSKLG